MTPTVILRKVHAWLRAGYPDGVPQQDYVALLGVLRHDLTDAEIGRIVAQLKVDHRAPEGFVDDSEIADTIAALVLEAPSAADVERVRGRLVACGWFQAEPHLSGQTTRDSAQGDSPTYT